MRTRREETRGQGDCFVQLIAKLVSMSMSISKYNLGKKNNSTSKGYISVKCQPIFNKFDPNKDASNICENERIFLNLLEFT